MIPTCTRYTLLVGGEVCGYRDVADWRKVAAADAELVACRAETAERVDLDAARRAEVDEWRLALDHERAARATIEAETARLRRDLIAKDAALQAERAKPRRTRTPWYVAGSLALALGVAVFAR